MDPSVPTRWVDRVSEWFPSPYWSGRIWSLNITLICLGGWALSGFDVAEGAVPLIGIQWSTLATFSFFFYLCMMNFQTGGLKSAKQMFALIKMDLSFCMPSFIHPFSTADRYPEDHASIDAFRAAVLSLCVCAVALLLFEVVWVFLYDSLQFGLLMWPVYSAQSTVAIRNFIGPLSFGMVFVTFPFASAVDGQKFRFSFRPRINGPWALLLLVALDLWLGWVLFPHSPGAVAQVFGASSASYSSASCYVMPSQGLFPQNTYTFYPCSDARSSYPLKDIYGFFVANDGLHAVNVLTKFATFAAVIYPAMGFVSKRS